MSSLLKLRKNIDQVDRQIISLLNERAELATQVACLKKKKRIDIFSPERESIILRKIRKLSKGFLKDTDIEIIFREIISVCRALRVTLNVSYLGGQGTFTHLAAIKKFGKSTNFVSCGSIRDVFVTVEKGDADYGVVPVENSIEGAINYTLDMFLESNLKICSEVFLNISHSLLRIDNESELIKIYSNPQVFPQCRRWLTHQYPKAQLIPTSTTARAAIQAKEDKTSACIGNKMLAALYGLNEINSHIENSSSNVTRFLVVSAKDSLVSGKDKTSIVFSIKDKVGALYDALYFFKKSGINLTKIESRPSRGKLWQYCYFADFQGHHKEDKIAKALGALEKKCIFLKILGSYPEET